MEALIHFLIYYNDKIIAITLGVFCLLSAIIIWREFFVKKEEKSVTANFDFSQIEESLKKILNQTNTAIGKLSNAETVTTTPVPQPAGVSTELTKIVGINTLEGKPIKDIEGIKEELDERAKLIEELCAQVKKSAADLSPELLEKISDLEERLAEYEIIEDDIADLSVFKEENARLKKELETIKIASPQMVDQFADAVAQAEQKATKAADGDIAVKTVVAEAAPVPVPVPVPVPEMKDNIFAEFIGDPEAEEQDLLAALREIDTDKILDELKDIEVDPRVGLETLEKPADVEKMVSDAASLSKKG
ncbi:MAG: hypothetical protein A2Z20_06625 [Bdellovibrionales bacterium RBG_16_40_8]|nr:MAG: hypothetical protein A2Z20_06625 [Bdellovibrionales bacterium RBG_16_40_8]